MSGSRKGFLLLAVVPFLYAGICFKGTKRVMYLMLAGAIVVSIIFLIATTPELYNVMGQRVEYIWDSILNGGLASNSDESLDERSWMRSYAISMFVESPIWGNGMRGFAIEMASIGRTFSYSHCNFTELLCNYGLIGFVLYYWIFIAILRKATLFIGEGRRHLIALYITIIVIIVLSDYSQVNYYLPMISYLVCFVWRGVNIMENE